MKTASVVIIDYGVGNLTSVSNALKTLGVEALISDDVKDIEKATHLILPGVGSFVSGMKGLERHGLVKIIQKEVLENKKKILGICLGMQLFADVGFEHGKFQGLGLLKGKVVKIDTAESGLRLPHIGWNNATLTQAHSITANLPPSPTFYFVHSYRFEPLEREVIVAEVEYGEKIAAIVEHGNIFGTQFHPEKSHTDGMQILKNFINL